MLTDGGVKQSGRPAALRAASVWEVRRSTELVTTPRLILRQRNEAVKENSLPLKIFESHKTSTYTYNT